MQPVLIVFTGLPGTGKSTLAEALGQMLQTPVFAKDWLESALLACELQPRERIAFAGYELLTLLTERQLGLGQSAILDSVASPPAVRVRWSSLAQRYRAAWRLIECICSDEAVHRRRLAGRERHIPGWRELSWADVEHVRQYYAPWSEPRLTVDAVQPLQENLARVCAYVQGADDPSA